MLDPRNLCRVRLRSLPSRQGKSEVKRLELRSALDPPGFGRPRRIQGGKLTKALCTVLAIWAICLGLVAETYATNPDWLFHHFNVLVFVFIGTLTAIIPIGLFFQKTDPGDR